MTENHDRIEELMAGHALGVLEGEDRVEADRLLAEHVPTCDTCRAFLEGSNLVVGDLALAAPPVTPPDLMWRRLRKDVIAPSAAGRRRLLTWGPAFAAAAAVVALVTWNATLNSRLSDEAQSQRHLSTAITTIADPSSTRLRLDSTNEPNPLTGAYTRQAHLTIIGVDVPDPAPGQVYRVWLVGVSGSMRASDFRPDHGLVILNLTVDPTLFSRLVITEEPAGRPAPGPAGVQRWSTSL
jgi:anti-sigma-K factor RskA